jgi:hypothetical protein
MIKIEFIHEDPHVVRSDMAAILGVHVLTTAAAVQVAEAGETAQTHTEPTGGAEGSSATAAKTTRTRKKADDKPAISTNPEDRRPPEDDAETQAQDTADEQAEVEAARDPEKPLTVEDVKAAVGEYVAKFGMAETQKDGVNIFADALGTPPAGEPFWKMSLLAGVSQEQLQKAVVAWKTAAAAQKRYVAKG